MVLPFDTITNAFFGIWHLPMLFVLFPPSFCWNVEASVMLTLCWVIVPDLWVSALASFVFPHRCHSLSLCIVNDLCRCAVLVLPASRFCWCPLIISLLIEMAFISTAAFAQSDNPVLRPPTLASTSKAILSNGVIWERPTCLLISYIIFIIGAVSLLQQFSNALRLSNWGDRLLLHIRLSIKSGAGGWGVELGQLCARERQVIGCCLLDTCMVPRWCFGRLICSISVRSHHLFTLTACVRKIKHGTWKTDICCCSECVLEESTVWTLPMKWHVVVHFQLD